MLPVKNKAHDGQTALHITTKEPDTPEDNESSIRLSLSGELCSSSRKDVVKFVRDRLKLDFQTQQRFGFIAEEDGEGAEYPPFPTVDQVIESFFEEDFDHVLSYQKPALLLPTINRHFVEYFAAIAKQHAPGVRIAGLNKACTDQLVPIFAHYVRGKTVIKSYARALAEEKARDNEDTNPFTQLADSDDLIWGSKVAFWPYIVEAPHTVGIDVNDPNDSLVLPLIKRSVLKEAARHPNEQGMTADIYLHLAMQSIQRRRKMIDDQTFTILDGEPLTRSGRVPIGHCHAGRPTITSVESDVIFRGRGRFRRVLRGSCGIDC